MVIVSNKDPFDWLEVRLNVNDYELTQDRIGAGAVVELPFRDFANADGLRFNPITMKPRTVRIRARPGALDRPLAVYAGGFTLPTLD